MIETSAVSVSQIMVAREWFVLDNRVLPNAVRINPLSIPDIRDEINHLNGSNDENPKYIWDMLIVECSTINPNEAVLVYDETLTQYEK